MPTIANELVVVIVVVVVVVVVIQFQRTKCLFYKVAYKPSKLCLPVKLGSLQVNLDSFLKVKSSLVVVVVVVGQVVKGGKFDNFLLAGCFTALKYFIMIGLYIEVIAIIYGACTFVPPAGTWPGETNPPPAPAVA